MWLSGRKGALAPTDKEVKMAKVRSEKDLGSKNYGYGRVRTYLTKAMRVRADRALLRAANEIGMTAVELRMFSESKVGRWYGDRFIAKGELTASLKGRRTIEMARSFLVEVC
jgi:hypothetical protein